MVSIVSKKIFSYHFIKFIIVGIIGFSVAATILKLYLISIESDPISARAFSFPIAVTTTWLLNRHYTFSKNKTSIINLFKEWSGYFLVNSLGFIINIISFTFIISEFSNTKSYPIIILGFSSSIAMLFNYIGSKYWIFANYNK